MKTEDKTDTQAPYLVAIRRPTGELGAAAVVSSQEEGELWNNGERGDDDYWDYLRVPVSEALAAPDLLQLPRDILAETEHTDSDNAEELSEQLQAIHRLATAAIAKATTASNEAVGPAIRARAAALVREALAATDPTSSQKTAAGGFLECAMLAGIVTPEENDNACASICATIPGAAEYNDPDANRWWDAATETPAKPKQ